MTTGATISDLHLFVHPGDGIVAAFGSAVFACLPTVASQQRAASELLGLVEQAASDAAMPGRVVAQAVAELLGRTAPTDVPPFAVLSPSDEGLAVLLQGDIELEVHQAGGHNVISGREAITWVERVIRGSFDRIEIRRTDGLSALADGRSRLDRGIVPGSGLTIVPTAAAAAPVAAAAPPVAAPPPPPPFAAPVPEAPTPFAAPLPAPPGPPPAPPGPPPGLGPPPVVNPLAPPPSVPPPTGPAPGAAPAAPPAAAMPPPAPPAPAAPPPAPVAPAPAAPPLATPPAPPAAMGTPPPPMAPPGATLAPPPAPTPVATPPPPPPPARSASPGVLVGDDGSRIELDNNYILGREPFEHPDVTGGTARPFLFLDTESEISRAHTRVSVSSGQVTITDLKSANGTYIAVPGASEWQGLVPHSPTPIAPGTRILIGQRTFVFHAT